MSEVTVNIANNSQPIQGTLSSLGLRGFSAYELAVKNGFTGTEAAWLESLKASGPSKTSELQNDSNFITKAVNDLVNYYKKSETYTKAEVDALIDEVPKLEIKVVDALPTANISTSTIYFLRSGSETQNTHLEYVYVDNAWEMVGSQSVDLSSYYKKTEVNALLDNKADKIDGTVISDNADFAEVGKWFDGNVNNENRIGYFVTLKKEIEGFVIDKATSTSDVCGVIVESPAFSGNAEDRYDSNGNLLKQYDYVALLGLVSVVDNGTCTVPGKCMPADDGTAVPSTNSMGFNVIARLDANHVEVFVRPGADMIKRIKDDISTLNTSKQDALVSGTSIKTINGSSILGSGNIQISNNNAYTYIKQLADYLFEVQYSHQNIDYSLGNTYFAPAAGCSGVVKSGRVLRHLDWYYDDGVEFVVRTVADSEQGLKASIGMCCGITGLTKSVVESGVYNEKFKIAPLVMTDGINEDGVYIQSNVVPKAGITYNLNPDSDEDCCITMVVRYILDHCSNFDDVCDVFDNLHIYSTDAIDYGYHFLFAKGTEWHTIELTANGWSYTTTEDMPHGIMTNFRTTDLIFSDGALDWNSVEDYGIGVERYEIAQQAFGEDNLSLEDLREELMYSKTYTNTSDMWYTEFAGYENPLNPGTYLTVIDAKTDPSGFNSIFIAESAKNSDKTRSNGQGIWHTVHSAIYDLSNKSFNLVIQERVDEPIDVYLDSQSEMNAIVNTLIAKIEAGDVTIPMVPGMTTESVKTLLNEETDNDLIDTIPEIIEYIQSRQDEGMDDALSEDELSSLLT